MEFRNHTQVPDHYDTSINIVGGLRDCSIVLKAINSYFDQTDSFYNLIRRRNEFNLRTEKSRIRIQSAVNHAFIHFINSDHEDLLQGITKDDIPLKDMELVLIWQYALNNRLFREITAMVFIKVYHSGRITISKFDILGYLKELQSQNIALQTQWSENTISTLSTKYINLMSKLGFLSAGRIKSFHPIRPSSESLVIFLYFARLFSPTGGNILANDFLPLSFIPTADILDRMKKLSMKGFFNMSYNGTALNIELIHSYKGICDALYSRS